MNACKVHGGLRSARQEQRAQPHHLQLAPKAPSLAVTSAATTLSQLAATNAQAAGARIGAKRWGRGGGGRRRGVAHACGKSTNRQE